MDLKLEEVRLMTRGGDTTDIGGHLVRMQSGESLSRLKHLLAAFHGDVQNCLISQARYTDPNPNSNRNPKPNPNPNPNPNPLPRLTGALYARQVRASRAGGLSTHRALPGKAHSCNRVRYGYYPGRSQPCVVVVPIRHQPSVRDRRHSSCALRATRAGARVSRCSLRRCSASRTSSTSAYSSAWASRTSL